MLSAPRMICGQFILKDKRRPQEVRHTHDRNDCKSLTPTEQIEGQIQPLVRSLKCIQLKKKMDVIWWGAFLIQWFVVTGKNHPTQFKKENIHFNDAASLVGSVAGQSKKTTTK